jgi:uncharacterized integral membrane protein
VFILVLLGVFVLANWTLLMHPTEINLLVTTAMVPGLIVGILLVAIVLIIDWSAHGLARREWNRERRALRDEIGRLQAQLAGEQDTKLGTLRELIEREGAQIRARIDELHREDERRVPARLPSQAART